MKTGRLADIAALLQEKAEIDAERDGVTLAMASHDRWLADAVELLLMIASEEIELRQPVDHG